MNPGIDPTDPANLTPDERLTEVARQVGFSRVAGDDTPEKAAYPVWCRSPVEDIPGGP